MPQGRPWLLLMARLLLAHRPAGTLQPRKSCRRVRGIGAGVTMRIPFRILVQCEAQSCVCSTGKRAPGQIVVWTGTLVARQKVVGVTLNWCVAHVFVQSCCKIAVGNVSSALVGTMVLAVQGVDQCRRRQLPGGHLLARRKAYGGLIQGDSDV